MSRRRSSAGQLVTIYWRDIPAQVTASRGRDKQKWLLEPRFQHAIDRAATVAGLTDTHSYVAQWRREAQPVGEVADLLAAAQAEAARLEQAHPPARLEELVAAGGLATDPHPAVEETP